MKVVQILWPGKPLMILWCQGSFFVLKKVFLMAHCSPKIAYYKELSTVQNLEQLGHKISAIEKKLR